MFQIFRKILCILREFLIIGDAERTLSSSDAEMKLNFFHSYFISNKLKKFLKSFNVINWRSN